MAVLEVKNIKKTYVTRLGGARVEALKGVNFSVQKGEYVAIMGESGSGKTTLLNIIASFDVPTSGQIVLDGREMGEVGENELAKYRRKNLGFVFQDFNLLDTFSIKDNIVLPLILDGKKERDVREKLNSVASQLNITEILGKYPYEVSGGQKQRTAVARAIITDPKLVLADEPTGALDSQSSTDLLKVFEKINKSGQTIIMVTHSIDAASHANRIIFIKDGVAGSQILRRESNNEQLYKRISDALTMMNSGRSQA